MFFIVALLYLSTAVRKCVPTYCIIPLAELQSPAFPLSLLCAQAVEEDMTQRTRPMDRLVCGDVGFGKTEVALRAVYRSVRSNRQVCV